jgi:hypothetical protein
MRDLSVTGRRKGAMFLLARRALCALITRKVIAALRTLLKVEARVPCTGWVEACRDEVRRILFAWTHNVR